MVKGTHINAYSVRLSGCTADIVHWRHSIIHHQSFTQCHTIWPTDSFVKYTTNQHTENWHHVYLCSLMLIAVTVQGQDSKKEEAIHSWKLCYSKQFFSPIWITLIQQNTISYNCIQLTENNKIRLKLTQLANSDWKSMYKEITYIRKTLVWNGR